MQNRQVRNSRLAASLSLSYLIIGGVAVLIGLGTLAFIYNRFGFSPRPLIFALLF